MNKVLIKGRISYKEKQHFDNAVAFLVQEKFVQDGSFVNFINGEIDYVTSKKLQEIDEKNLTIEIPLHYYENLQSKIVQLFVGGTGRVLWVNLSEGKTEAGHITDGNSVAYDIVKWMMENAGETEKTIPTRDSDKWADWCEDAEMDFVEELQLI